MNDTVLTDETKSEITFGTKEDGDFLKLDKEGFHFKGETIKDAGKAYKAFSEWLEYTKKAA